MRARFHRLIRLTLATLGLASCEWHERLVERDVAVDGGPVTLHFAHPYRAAGPTRELCLELASPIPPGVALYEDDAHQHPIITAVLVRDSGARDTLGFDLAEPAYFGGARQGTPALDLSDDRRTLCSWDHRLTDPKNESRWKYVHDSTGHIIEAFGDSWLPPLSATYVAVELSSDRRLDVHAVSFWSGQRHAFL